MSSPLKIELRTYRSLLGDFLADKREGQHVVIQGKTVLGFYPTFEEALETAYGKFGDQYFLVREIAGEEVPDYLPICGHSDAITHSLRRH